MQFDADCVGAPGPSADAEMCMMMADAIEAAGIPRGDYVIRVNNRKVLDGVMEAIEIPDYKRLDTLRALDKADKFPLHEVDLLLTTGRKDPSGDFTKGVGLTKVQSSKLLSVFAPENAYKAAYEKEDGTVGFLSGSPDQIYLNWDDVVRAYEKIGLAKFFGKPSENNDLIALLNVQVIAENNPIVLEGVIELLQILKISQDMGYSDRIKIDPSVVRGLEYYTGAVFECELTFETVNEKGEKARFGSVAGGGRYDGLVSRFGVVPTPATGFSIGVSRLMAALANLGKIDTSSTTPPVIVCVMDRDVESLGRYQTFAQDLRNAGIRAEMFQGNPKQFGKQLQYADRRGAYIAVIQGSEERDAGQIQLKDLQVGAELAKDISDRAAWVEERAGQITIPEADLVMEVQKLVARYQGGTQ
jgi:histidyl-tRNA synthetase